MRQTSEKLEKYPSSPGEENISKHFTCRVGLGAEPQENFNHFCNTQLKKTLSETGNHISYTLSNHKRPAHHNIPVQYLLDFSDRRGVPYGHIFLLV